MIQRAELEKYLNTLLQPELFNDYGPNGLQIEGKQEIKKIAFSLSATRHSVSCAVKENADTLICHHGLFWKFHGVRTLTGPFAKRVLPLVRNEINLFGYHLPLDAQIEMGNAATIAKKLGLTNLAPFGDHKGSPTGVKGVFKSKMKASDVKTKLEKILNHDVLHAVSDTNEIESMGIITGGANSGWQDASYEGLDSYLTGEMSEHDWHESAEAGVHMFAGGHNATEELGIKNLMSYIQAEFSDLECFFIEHNNPA